MAGMSDGRRRMIMMLTIIFAGSALTFIDLSPLLVLVIAVVMGIVMLFALGMVTFGEIKAGLKAFRHRLSQPVTFGKKKGDKKSGKEKPPEDITGDSKKGKEKKGGLFSGKEKGEKESKVPFAGLIAKLPFGKNKSGKDRAEKDSGEKGKSESSGRFAGVGGLFSSLKSGKGKARDEKTKEIDELLDKTVNDVSPSASESEGEALEEEISGEGSESGEDEDEFSDFDSLDLGLEEDSDELDSSAGSMIQAEEEIPESTIADILAKEGIDLDLELEDDEFSGLAGVQDESESSDEISGSEDISSLDEDISGLEFDGGDDFDDLDELDDLDLDEIEIDEEEEFEPEEEISVELGDGSEDAESGSPDMPDEEEDIFAAPPKEWEQGSFGLMSEESEGEDSFTASFESGGDEGDLFAMLKSDTQKAVNIQETSLVRDMKDVRVSSEELIDGLETLMFSLGVEIEKTNKAGEKEDNEELSVVLNQGSEE